MAIRLETLASDVQRELDEFYWTTDVSASELQKHFGLIKPLHSYITPLTTDQICPNCGSPLSFLTRTRRFADEKTCSSCGHRSISIHSCRCPHCTAKVEQEREVTRKEAHRQAIEQFEVRKQETSSENYVGWALSKIPRRTRMFLKSLLEALSESTNPTWEEICHRAQVVTHQTYVSTLSQIGLIYLHPDGYYVPNPAIRAENIEIKNVRQISKGKRFDVFQRDQHTCQYCGRRPPEIELVVDHLLPVAEGGTDDFENLVASCADCNSGKSAKLIEKFTDGHTKEAWRDLIRQKRDELLASRRSRLEEVIAFWSECRKRRFISEYDLRFIHSFIERYDPDWIKTAIRISTDSSCSNYGKYTAGILRKWAQNGPPKWVADPEANLKAKKATPKQLDYVRYLLRCSELSLADVYPKQSLEELTMYDAKQLIEALRQPADSDSKYLDG